MNWMNCPALAPIDAVKTASRVASKHESNGAAVLEERLSDQWGVSRAQICVTDSPWLDLISALVPADKRVFLAAPTSEDVLEAIVEAGSRYIDVGRNHVFQIDGQGWDLAASDPSTALAYVGSPNIPTSSVPMPALIQRALDAGKQVVWDHRSTPYELGWSNGVANHSHCLRVGIVGCGSGVDGELPAVVMGDELLIESIRQWIGPRGLKTESVSLAHLTLDNPEQCTQRHRRLLEWTNNMSSALQSLPGLVVLGTAGRCVWVRCPGIPSVQLAESVNHSLVFGSEHWTWRDAVAVLPSEPGLQTRVLVDAFQAAM